MPIVGVGVGRNVGDTEGWEDGREVGPTDGILEGMVDGAGVGATTGVFVGCLVGLEEGDTDTGGCVSITSWHPKYAGGLPETEQTVSLTKGKTALVRVPVLGNRCTEQPADLQQVSVRRAVW